MENSSEIKALVKLLDDTDPEVFEQVAKRLLEHGTSVIHFLETEWEKSLDTLLQERIENIVHQIQFNTVKEDLNLWYQSGAFDLLQGALVLNRYQYPDLDEQKVINQIEEIKREIWTGLQYEMSSVEKIKLINHIFYNIHGFKGNTKNHHDPQNSYINQVLETKKGNQISLAIIYATIAQKLDIPVYGVNLPQHFILGYIDESKKEEHEFGVLFYINAFNKGAIFGKHDVDQFLRQLNLQPLPGFYAPCSNVEIIRRIIRNLISAYENLGSEEKVQELKELQDILINPEI
ncbi:regulator of sirC expression with transglutaminase-like and TPR domain [Pedobacter cryoconitis]|uniref:Regulator of sirC expression with transglutaminase-like and TPR domain n=1 Tax=Pedobacter cryoconitis TaxID=188932 RepID=A0A7W8ZKW8_9SPHI|nr:transglutaminase-like domain-containing protein [Pedobacter cryoconitis]MBB5635777.1 regulator of sirC expression with transglutaminase-like and TPR domain [Pedobacter cryoconitis]MBB6273324.1 regulator of sirC expression with transglutaminase-like and TPR domain [Pedobacter cryoconitis]